MADYIKLATAPQLVVHYPECGACLVETDLEGGVGFTCPVCGTCWPVDASDGDTGELYEDWSGDKLHTEPVTEEHAVVAGLKYQRADMARLLGTDATKERNDQ